MQDRELDGLLAMMAQQPATPSAGLMDRVLTDALALQPQPAVLAPAATPPQRLGVLTRLAGLFGGAPVLAGVFSAAVAGVALGYLNPATMDLFTGGLTEAESLDLFPSADFLMTEG